MPGDWRVLLALIFVFGPLSLFSIGGGASLLAEIEHQSVAVHHWTTHREFADLFAISRAAPGPGTMLSTLIGWHVAGWPGALAATVALYLPSSLLVFGASRLWGRWRGSRLAWRDRARPRADRRRADAGGRARGAAGGGGCGGVGRGGGRDRRAAALAAAQPADPVRRQRRIVRRRRSVWPMSDWRQDVTHELPDDLLGAAGGRLSRRGRFCRPRGQDPVLEPVGDADLRFCRDRGAGPNPRPDRSRGSARPPLGGLRPGHGRRREPLWPGDLLSVPAMRKDGTRISIEFTVLPMHDDAGAMLGIAAFLRDVTARFEELRALRRELAVLKAPAELTPGSDRRSACRVRIRSTSATIAVHLREDQSMAIYLSRRPTRRKAWGLLQLQGHAKQTASRQPRRRGQPAAG